MLVKDVGRAWKETVYNVYKDLVELVHTKGTNKIRLIELAVKSGYSPIYLRSHIIPVLTTLINCVKYSRGIIIYECEGEAK